MVNRLWCLITAICLQLVWVRVVIRLLKLGLLLVVMMTGCLLVSLVVNGRTSVSIGTISIRGRALVVMLSTMVTCSFMALVAGSNCLRGSALYEGKIVALNLRLVTVPDSLLVR